uniref:Uncharacterized protein n=1 Tax=viral metagenome TaxID=1070528 RepID=A0A6C0JTV0_9ZZZZ
MSGTSNIPPVTGNYKVDIVVQITNLAIGGFSLVAALAWNEAIKRFIEKYVKVWLPEMSETLSLLIYALIVTALAIFVTITLTIIKQEIINTPSVPLQQPVQTTQLTY